MMAKFKITAPDQKFEGILGGARFINGVAEVEDGHAALSYARRRGYTVERVGGEPEASEESDESEGSEAPAPERPGKGDSKAEWVAYAAATMDLSAAEAEDMTKAELIELADSEE